MSQNHIFLTLAAFSLEIFKTILHMRITLIVEQSMCWLAWETLWINLLKTALYFQETILVCEQVAFQARSACSCWLIILTSFANLLALVLVQEVSVFTLFAVALSCITQAIGYLLLHTSWSLKFIVIKAT